MARKPNTEQRREQIVKGLLEAIGEHGYDKATIQTIAQKAGLAPGLIHYHFKSKEDILLELVKSLAAVARRIEARGEIPFLHVFSNNTSAIALYQRQGMRIRRRLYVTAFMREG